MEAAEPLQVAGAEEDALAQNPVGVFAVGGQVPVFAAVPGHVVEGVPAGCKTGVEVAGDVFRLNDVVGQHPRRAGAEVIPRGAAVGVNIVDQEVFTRRRVF
ncbi:hypothetical protein D3C85_1216410 [compost metagenome]